MKDWQEAISTLPAALGVMLLVVVGLYLVVPDENGRGFLLGSAAVGMGIFLIVASFRLWGKIPK